MSDEEFADAIYEAFLHATKTLGPDVRGMSCFMANWPQVSNLQAAHENAE